MTAYEADHPDCKPRVYTQGMGFVDPGDGHVHNLGTKAASRHVRSLSNSFRRVHRAGLTLKIRSSACSNLASPIRADSSHGFTQGGFPGLPVLCGSNPQRKPSRSVLLNCGNTSQRAAATYGFADPGYHSLRHQADVSPKRAGRSAVLSQVETGRSRSPLVSSWLDPTPYSDESINADKLRASRLEQAVLHGFLRAVLRRGLSEWMKALSPRPFKMRDSNGDVSGRS